MDKEAKLWTWEIHMAPDKGETMDIFFLFSQAPAVLLQFDYGKFSFIFTLNSLLLKLIWWGFCALQANIMTRAV